MTTAHRRNNNNGTYPNSHIRNNFGIGTRPSGSGSRTPSVPFVQDAVSRAGFDVDDGGLSVAIASLGLSPVPNHPRTTSGGSSTGSIASTSSGRFERTNNVPPRHRGSEKEYTQFGLQSPREKQRDRHSEVRLCSLGPIYTTSRRRARPNEAHHMRPVAAATSSAAESTVRYRLLQFVNISAAVE